MNRSYWEALGEDYAAEIFSVIGHDQKHAIAAHVEHWADSAKTAADLGCGPGQTLDLLGRNFGTVHACDWSPALLDQARKIAADLPSVAIHEFDLAADAPPPFDPVSFALCLNVIIMPDAEVRERVWRTVTNLISADGRLLLVLPSHESALYTGFRRMDWNLRAGLGGTEAEEKSHEPTASPAAKEQGVRPIDGTLTKHYLREEIEVQLRDHGFNHLKIEKLPYSWKTEFDDPPDWMELVGAGLPLEGVTLEGVRSF
mgnify:CR=1 FL=1